MYRLPPVPSSEVGALNPYRYWQTVVRGVVVPAAPRSFEAHLCVLLVLGAYVLGVSVLHLSLALVDSGRRGRSVFLFKFVHKSTAHAHSSRLCCSRFIVGQSPRRVSAQPRLARSPRHSSAPAPLPSLGDQATSGCCSPCSPSSSPQSCSRTSSSSTISSSTPAHSNMSSSHASYPGLPSPSPSGFCHGPHCKRSSSRPTTTTLVSSLPSPPTRSSSDSVSLRQSPWSSVDSS